MQAAQTAALVLAAAVAAAPSVARADIGDFNPDAFDLSAVLDRPVAPVRGALELAVGGGYTVAGGGAGGQLAHVEDLSDSGGAAAVQIGVRLTPTWAIGAYGELARFGAGPAADPGARVFGAAAGVQATVHGRPNRSVDPWASLGAGWRGMWLAPQGGGERTSLQGLELARVQLGVDYRISRSLAVSPVIGASAAMFLAEDSPMTSDLAQIHGKSVHYYAFSGVQGRFDL